MANRYAVASGNWSNTATWDGGTLPTSADDVFSNNFTVTIDGTFTVLSIRNTASAPIVAGGTFTFANGGNLTCTASPAIYLGTTTPVLQMTLSAGNTATFTGTVLTCANIQNSIAISLSGEGTLNLIGDYSGDGTTSNSLGNKSLISITANGNLNITGNLNNTTISNGSQSTKTISGNSGTISIIGNVTTSAAGGTTAPSCETILLTSGIINIIGNVSNGSNSTTKYTINTGAGPVTISGNVVGGIAPAVYSTAATLLTVNGNISASSAGAAVVFTNVASQLNLSGSLYNIDGKNAAMVPKLFVNSAQSMVAQFYNYGGQNLTMYSQDTLANYPSASNVRQGTVYGVANGSVGTLAIPNATDVRNGVTYDATTTGSGLFTTDTLLSEISSSSEPIAARIRNAGTVEVLGKLLESFRR